MIDIDKIVNGNRFIGKINKEIFTIIDVKNEKDGKKYVYVQCQKSTQILALETFRRLQLEEI